MAPHAVKFCRKWGADQEVFMNRNRNARANELGIYFGAMPKTFLTQAIRRHGGVPEKITVDGSAANEAAIKTYNEEHGTAIEIRKIKYLNNIVEQDHRAVKRVPRPM